MATYTALDGACRIYDGTATPYFIEVLFDQGDLSFPEGKARPEETPIMHRGRAVTATVHHIIGDDTPVVEPTELSFSFRMQNDVANEEKLYDALCNPSLVSPWTVGADTWDSTKGDAALVNGKGDSFVDPAFADPMKKCVNFEILWSRDGVDIGRKIVAVYIAPDQISLAEAEDSVMVSVTGQVYGETSRITAFTAGSESQIMNGVYSLNLQSIARSNYKHLTRFENFLTAAKGEQR